MEFLKLEYWSGLPIPSPRDLPEPGIEPGSPALSAGPDLEAAGCGTEPRNAGELGDHHRRHISEDHLEEDEGIPAHASGDPRR